ncbi:hypothetical protein Q9R19_10290 [Microbacterium sp. ARD32]|uniref:hypothetical protein n=1 Tax=Microbacterium sp. ARD32 TaxID=2962577 RepID=UPI002882CD83|nr:hypothetical protein [Microbacterium sp. ARD32]MDT0158012.1 hypothetical protein [Microbacterium sp. ARD32]
MPVSAGLLHDPRAYFQALTDYRAGDVDAIVHAVTNAMFAAIRNGRRLASDLADIRDEWAATVRSRSGSSARRLMDALLAQPVITTKTAADALSVSEVAASTAINRLADAGVLTKASGRARYRIWQAPEVIAALDDFAERARRGRI